MSDITFTGKSNNIIEHNITMEFMPEGYQEVDRNSVTIDGELAELIRYQPPTSKTTLLGREHFSILTTSDGLLKGFSSMAPSLVKGDLPSKDEAKKIAIDFISRFAKDLLPVLKIHWIKPHKESFTMIQDEKKKTLVITGIKVKMQNTSDGRWMWTIIGPSKKVIIFERDVVWISFPGLRQTEKWLHDSWLEDKT